MKIEFDSKLAYGDNDEYIDIYTYIYIYIHIYIYIYILVVCLRKKKYHEGDNNARFCYQSKEKI